MADQPVAPLQDPILTRIRGEYLEMPGLRLTFAQAQRLWGLDSERCEQLLSVLVAERFLCRGGDGAYGRAIEGRYSFWPIRMAKAETPIDPRGPEERARPSPGPQRASEPRGMRPVAGRRP